MNTTYLDKLEFNKIKEMLGNFSCTYVGKKLCFDLQPINVIETVQHNLQETQEAVNLIERNNTPSFYEYFYYLKNTRK